MQVRFNRSKGDKIYAKVAYMYFHVICVFGLWCGILLTPLLWFEQIKRTVSFDVTTRFNAIQQSTAMYNSHIFNVRNTTINVTKRSTINESINSNILGIQWFFYYLNVSLLLERFKSLLKTHLFRLAFDM